MEEKHDTFYEHLKQIKMLEKEKRDEERKKQLELDILTDKILDIILSDLNKKYCIEGISCSEIKTLSIHYLLTNQDDLKFLLEPKNYQLLSDIIKILYKILKNANIEMIARTHITPSGNIVSYNAIIERPDGQLSFSSELDIKFTNNGKVHNISDIFFSISTRVLEDYYYGMLQKETHKPDDEKSINEENVLLKAICKNRNRMLELEKELPDILTDIILDKALDELLKLYPTKTEETEFIITKPIGKMIKNSALSKACNDKILTQIAINLCKIAENSNLELGIYFTDYYISFSGLSVKDNTVIGEFIPYKIYDCNRRIKQKLENIVIGIKVSDLEKYYYDMLQKEEYEKDDNLPKTRKRTKPKKSTTEKSN